jgi:hypothetical protein
MVFHMKPGGHSWGTAMPSETRHYHTTSQALAGHRNVVAHVRQHVEGRYGNAELQPGRFYGYKGKQVWLDTVPGGFFAMVQGTAIQARGKTAGEALKNLRSKLDAGAANYRRRKVRR